MLKSVILACNPLDPLTYKEHRVDDVLGFIMATFAEWPETARLYHGNVSLDNDITPTSEEEVERINSLEGPFYVIVYPAEPTTIFLIVAAVIAVAAIATAFLIKPTVPNPTQRNVQSNSPNNALSDRSNKARPNSRIPDIFGTVRSTPDLIAVPYRVFNNHEEVEYCFMCIGRGAYDVSDVRDDTTLVADIPGSSVEVYPPNASPNFGSPQLTIGSRINEPLYNVIRSNSVDGQVLRPSNDQTVTGASDVRFTAPNIIETNSGSIDFTTKFAVGDPLTIGNTLFVASSVNDTRAFELISTSYGGGGSICFPLGSGQIPSCYVVGGVITIPSTPFYGYASGWVSFAGVYTIASIEIETRTTFDEYATNGTFYIYENYAKIHLVNPASVNSIWQFTSAEGTATLQIADSSGTYNLNGNYSIVSVSKTQLLLSNPASINSGWNRISQTPYISATLASTGYKWIGPFVLDSSSLDQVFANFVASSGLYKDNGTTQYAVDVTLRLELTPINADGSTRGSAELLDVILNGSSEYRGTRAVTLKANPTFTGRCKVRACRITATDTAFTGSVVDEIKWRDLYSVSPVTAQHFGAVTTVQTMTFATEFALAAKDRKLNMLVTRKLPQRVSGSTFTSTLYATNNTADILSAICLDTYIGNRTASEINFDSFYNSITAINSHFGTSLASQFNYTFDKDNVSFEETISSIAASIFCTAYRRGSQINLSFEMPTSDSVLLFNHRNKLPGSETRTVTFGNDNDNDGVEYTYVDPADDAVVTIYLPEDRSAINPLKIESIGVRSKVQAWFNAWRAYNKLRFQHVAVEFEATQEAALLVLKDRILVADNTRPDTQDGEVESQNGLVLTLSQNVKLTDFASYVIFLQHVDGTVESIGITAGSKANEVVLARAPRLALALAENLYARTTFVIVGNTETALKPFLLVEKTAQNNFTSTIKAINYSDSYYANDSDYANGIIDGNGNRI